MSAPDNTNTYDDYFIVREIKKDGKQEVYLLRASEFTLYAFQAWMLGINPAADNSELQGGSEVNEILAYYPRLTNAEHDRLSGTYGTPDRHWSDPENLPRRYL